MLVWLLACRDEPVEEWRCFGPLVELVKWRDGEELRPVAADVAAEEASRIQATVEALAPERRRCEAAWRMGLWSTPDNPGLRVRDQALRRLLGLPEGSYPPEAMGRR